MRRLDGALAVHDGEVMLIANEGQLVRIAVQGIRESGRNTQGVRLIRLSEGGKLQAIAP